MPNTNPDLYRHLRGVAGIGAPPPEARTKREKQHSVRLFKD
jgi:hypothetical protein